MSLSVFKTGLPSLGGPEEITWATGPTPPRRGRGSEQLPRAFQAVGAQHCRGGRTGGLQRLATCVPADTASSVSHSARACFPLKGVGASASASHRPACGAGLGVSWFLVCVEQIPPQPQRWVLTDRSQSGSLSSQGLTELALTRALQPQRPAQEWSAWLKVRTLVQ